MAKREAVGGDIRKSGVAEVEQQDASVEVRFIVCSLPLKEKVRVVIGYENECFLWCFSGTR